MNELTKLMKSDGLYQYYLIRQYGETGYEIVRINLSKNKGYYTLYRTALTDWEPTKVFDLTDNNDLLMLKEIVYDFVHNPDLTTGWNPQRISMFW